MPAIRIIDDHTELGSIGTNTHAQIDTHIGAADDYVKRDGSLALSADWDIGDTRKIHADEIRARDAAGLKLYDDGSNGIFVEDGGNVGIGIADPTSILHVSTTATSAPLRVQSTHATASSRWAGIEYLDSTGNVAVMTGLRGSTNEFRFNNVGTSGFIDFMIGTASKLHISNNGVIGLSNTDLETWTNFCSVLEGSTSAIFFGEGTDLYNMSNAYYSTGWKYKTTQKAAMYGMWQGDHYWRTANSGTADNAITWKEGIRLKSDGKVGINTVSPTAVLDVDSDIIRLRTAKTPATSGASGNAGDICWDAAYIYVCTATNTWERAAIAAW